MCISIVFLIGFLSILFWYQVEEQPPIGGLSGWLHHPVLLPGLSMAVAKKVVVELQQLFPPTTLISSIFL